MASTTAETWRPYRSMLRAQLRSQTSYRGSFAVEFVASGVFTAVDLLTVIVLFRVTHTLGGFGFVDSFLMASLANVGFATASLLVGNVDNLRDGIRTGQLDALLVRPLGLLRQLLATDFELRRVGRAAQALIALAVAIELAHVGWSWRTALLVVVSTLAGALFFASVFVVVGTASFWWIDAGEFANSFTDGGKDFTSYPITVYGDLFRRLFAFGLGFAFVAYYPVLALTREPDPLGLPTWIGWLSPVIATLAASVATIVWRIGIRHYRSTGS